MWVNTADWLLPIVVCTCTCSTYLSLYTVVPCCVNQRSHGPHALLFSLCFYNYAPLCCMFYGYKLTDLLSMGSIAYWSCLVAHQPLSCCAATNRLPSSLLFEQEGCYTQCHNRNIYIGTYWVGSSLYSFAALSGIFVVCAWLYHVLVQVLCGCIVATLNCGPLCTVAYDMWTYLGIKLLCVLCLAFFVCGKNLLIP